ncbi:MAG: protein kinase [Verrucomicrobiae bacterium]|nr:protein kinase [Verrucomicrobiae bacterium]
MSESGTCPRCGAEIPSDAPKGFCPRCLYQLGFDNAGRAGETAQANPSSSGSEPSLLASSFGDYELLQEIGHGGMGVVYKARQRSLDRVVALKVLLFGPHASAESVKRFRAEAVATAALQHPNIVAIHDVGFWQGQHYIAMDYVEGQPLSAMVHGRPLPARRAAAYLKTIAEAIHHAHEHGILHRDLKPANVLIDVDDQPRVTDFGLARRLEGDSDLTVTGQVLGSPQYMPPEQASGKLRTLSRRTDVYALGAILYHLLTGRSPFAGESVADTVHQVLNLDPVSPRLLNHSVPRDLGTVCLKCLEKEPAKRYATARALAEELSRFLEGKPVLARRVGRTARLWRWCRRQPQLAGLAAGLVLVFAAGMTGVIWQWQRAEAARRDGVEQLWRSFLAEGRATRWSRRAGQRFDSLAALGKAAAIRPSLELRNEAIAALALPDARVLRQWFLPRGFGFDFDPRLERYARADEEGAVTVYQVSDQSELMRFPGSGQPATVWLRFSPDGGWLAEKWSVPGTNQLRVWDLTQRKLARQTPPVAQDFIFRFAPDGQTFAVVNDDGTLRLHDLGHDTERALFASVPRANDLCFDLRGSWVAVSSSSSAEVKVFRVESGQVERILKHPTGVYAVAQSPHGHQMVCGGNNGAVYFWEVGSEKPQVGLGSHAGPITGSQFNRLGDLLVSTGWDGKTWFWDPAKREAHFALPGGYCSHFSPDDTRLGFLTGSHGDLQAGIWEVAPGRECRRLERLQALVIPGNAAGFSSEGRLLAVAARDGVTVWDLETNHRIGRLASGDSRSAIFLPDGRGLLTSGGGGIQCWPIERNVTTDTIQVGEPNVLWPHGVEHMALTPDGQAVIAVGVKEPDADALFLRLGEPAAPVRISGHPGSTWVSISPDGRWFASGNWKGRSVSVRELPTGRTVATLPVGENVSVAFSRDSRWLVTGSPVEYRFWDVPSWQPDRGIAREQAGDYVGAMVFSPDGRLLVLVQRRDTLLQLLDAEDNRPLATLEAGVPLGFSGDSRFLVTLAEDERTVLLWDLALIRRQLATLNLDWFPLEPFARSRRREEADNVTAQGNPPPHVGGYGSEVQSANLDSAKSPSRPAGPGRPTRTGVSR